MSDRGRRFHTKYESLKFASKKLENGRAAAICEICKITLKNTSISRLKTHRKRCYPSSDSEDGTYSDDSTSKTYNNNSTKEWVSLSQTENEARNNLDTIQNDKNVQEKPQTTEELEEEVLFDVEVCNDLINLDHVEIIDEDALQNIDVTAVDTPNNNLKDNDHNTYCLSLEDNSQNQVKKFPDIFETKNTSQSSISLSSQSTISKQKIKPSKKCKFRGNKILNSFIDTMSLDEKEKVDVALAFFFYGCNVPFSVIESEHFKNFIKILRPSYTAPCRKTLSSTLLDKVSIEVMNLNCQSVEKISCLLIDGWKNSSNNTKNVVTMLQTAGGRSLFLESFDLSTERETGEALAEICNKSIEIARSQYQCEVYSVVSDNASNMLKMGRLTTLWHSTCSSHTANLLAKDVLDSELIKKVNMILKEFKRTDLENLLKENGGYKIVLPAETRWCSHRDACLNFIKNLAMMKKICAMENIKIKAEITLSLYDDEFLEKVHKTIEILDPICILTNKCQSSNFSIADSTEEWISLKNALKDQNEINLFISNRFNMAVTVYGMAANFLHPLYNGKNLDPEQIDLVQEFLMDNLDANGLDGLHAFMNKKCIFLKLFQKEIVSADTFWGLVERKYPLLSHLALKLIKIPSSSAQLERIFSNWSFVHSPLRNRLGSDRSKKLISIYYSLKLKDSNKSDDY